MLGPVFGVEMVTGARRLRFYLIRAVYAFLLLFIFGTSYAMSMGAGVNTISQAATLTASFFVQFAFLQLTAVLLLGPALVGGTVASERERRTLEYLLASDLSSAEIILSKLGAGLLKLGVLVLVGVPVLALTMLFGGVPPELLLAVVAITLSTMLFVASASLLVSVRARRARDAVATTYLAVIVLFVAPLVLEGLLPLHATLNWLEPVNAQLMELNPYLLLFRRMLIGGVGLVEASDVLSIVVTQGCFTLAMVGSAIWGLRRVHQRIDALPRNRWLRWRTLRLRPALWDRALVWKELFASGRESKGNFIYRLANLLFGLLMIGWLGAAIYEAYVVRNFGASFHFNITSIGVILTLSALMSIAVRTATSIAAEREADTWDTLISTPVSAGEIVLSKVCGGVAAARWYLLLLLATWCVAALALPSFLLAVPFVVLTLIALTLATTAVGVCFSLWCRTSTRAMGATVATGLTVYGGYWIASSCLFVFVPTYSWGAGLYNIVQLMFLVPFLVAYPYVLGFDWAAADSSVVTPLAYLAGSGFYLIAGLILLVVAIGQFDRLAGRAQAMDEPSVTVHPRRLAPAPSSATAALRSQPGDDQPSADEQQAGEADRQSEGV